MDKLTRYKILIDKIQSELAICQNKLAEENSPTQFAKFHLIQIQQCISNLFYEEEIEKIMSQDIIPVPVNKMNNEVYDAISFATYFHYNDTYDCSPSAIEKLEKALEYRQYIQNDKLESKIEEYTHNYYEHHNAWEFVYNNSHKWQYRLTVLSKESVSGWEKLSDVPKYRKICDEDEIHGLIEKHMLAHPTGNPITRKDFYNSLVKMRIHNVDKHEWWQIYIDDIGWKPLQFRVYDILFTR